VNLAAFLKDDSDSKAKFRSLMQKHRFVVFQCDEETVGTFQIRNLLSQGEIAEYKLRGGQFFGLNTEEKMKYSSFHDTEKKQKVNRGYLFVDKVKEFLKVMKKVIIILVISFRSNP
jgi:hypothetical protein